MAAWQGLYTVLVYLYQCILKLCKFAAAGLLRGYIVFSISEDRTSYSKMPLFQILNWAITSTSLVCVVRRLSSSRDGLFHFRVFTCFIDSNVFVHVHVMGSIQILASYCVLPPWFLLVTVIVECNDKMQNEQSTLRLCPLVSGPSYSNLYMSLWTEIPATYRRRVSSCWTWTFPKYSDW